MHAELSSSAVNDNPQSAVEHFLAFYATLTRASTFADSLYHAAVTTPNELLDGGQTADEVIRISGEHRKHAESWVDAAIATDLSPFSLSDSVVAPPQPGGAPEAVALVSPHKSVAPRKFSSSSTADAVSQTKQRQSATAQKLRYPLLTRHPKEWVRGEIIAEAAAIGRALGREARWWFVGFVERFLDADGPRDRDMVTSMLSQMKRVNDWLDDVGGRRGDGGEGNGPMDDSGVPLETIERLRRKIYNYLLAHVDSATLAVGRGTGRHSSSSSSGGRKAGRGRGG